MKKKIVLLALIAGAFTQQAFAQEGGILLYGDFGFSSSSEKTDNGFTDGKDITTSVVFAPGIGYAMSDNLIVGLNISIRSTTFKPDGGNNTTNSTIMVGPFLRYTKKMGDIFSFYGQGNLSYVGGKSEDSYLGSTVTYKRSGIDFNVTPNIGIAVGKGWGLNFGFGALGFSSITEKNDDNSDLKNTSSDFGLNLNGSTLRWGVSYMFNCGKKE